MNPARAIGFDVGAQSVKAVVVDEGGHVLDQARTATGPDTDAAGLGRALAGLARGFRAVAGDADLPVGCGVAGVFDPDGTLAGCPNLPHLEGVALAERLGAALGAPVVCDNDANCAALAEGWCGAARDTDDFLALTLGTGLGSGLVLGGRLHAGPTGHGCELGHMMVVYGGRLCGCGRRGCLEAYVSETGIHARLVDGDPVLRARIESIVCGEGLGWAHALFTAADRGDAEAGAASDHTVDILGAAIGSAINVLDVTTVVLGGGIAPAVLKRGERLRAAVAAQLFARDVDSVRLLAAGGGPLAGAIGAARLVATG